MDKWQCVFKDVFLSSAHFKNTLSKHASQTCSAISPHHERVIRAKNDSDSSSCELSNKEPSLPTVPPFFGPFCLFWCCFLFAPARWALNFCEPCAIFYPAARLLPRFTLFPFRALLPPSGTRANDHVCSKFNTVR